MAKGKFGTDCGCNCKLCRCSEGACHVHPHCYGKKCNPAKLLESITRNFSEFMRADFDERSAARKLIDDFGKW